jgi:small-conductance mechanosensitive channel
MKTIICWFISMMMFVISISVHAMDTPHLNSDKSSYFNTIEKTIHIDNKENIDTDTINQFKQELRQIQKTAQETIITLEQEKQSQNQLLDALGVAPDKEKGEQESEQVSKIRKQINEQIITIDGKIKKEQLDIARSNDLISALDGIKQEQLQSKLIARLPSPFMLDALLSASREGLDFIQTMYTDPVAISLIIFLLLLNLVSFPLLRLLKRKQQEFTRISLGHIRHRLIVQLIFSSTVIIILRFSNFDTGAYHHLRHLAQACAAILLALSLYELLNKIKFVNCYDETQFNYIPPFWVSVKNKLKFIVLLFIPLSVIGFTEFASYFVFNIFTIILAVIFFVFMRAMAIHGLFAIERLKKESSVKSYEDLLSSAPTILIIEPISALLTTGFALFFWGLDTTELQVWAEKYSNGIPIGQLTLNFHDMGAAVVSFIAIYILFRGIKWFLASRVFPKTSLDAGIVNAILTVLGYIGIVSAVLSASGALGFDASNLAIVAGALSVGIGFGLQTIFSNFVSGLIVLFERPFKVGDLVQVNEFEGLIRKISVRSTEIETFQRSSVIVPNSKMISDVVINRTLHNALARVDVMIGVAYNSDVQKVKELLLQAAEENETVLKNPVPFVLFRNFGESALEFELRCFVPDVHSAIGIGSDLRFVIYQKCKDNHIEIPFPQRDLHIRSGFLSKET